MSELIQQQNKVFEALKRFTADGKEYWLARDLMKPLGYSTWRRFEDAIDRAKLACQNSGNNVDFHFAGAVKMDEIGGSGNFRELADYQLSRYGCYLTAMNGDPRKPEIAAAQSYFAVKSHEAETVIPAQIAELEKLKLQLEVAQAQERAATAQKQLMTGVQTLEAIAPGLGQLALGRADMQVERVVEVERHIVVNNRGQVVHDHAGLSPTKVAQRLGMKAAKDLKAWLASIGRLDLIDEAQTIVTCHHIRTENIQEIEQLWGQRQGTRQKLLGEWT